MVTMVTGKKRETTFFAPLDDFFAEENVSDAAA